MLQRNQTGSEETGIRQGIERLGPERWIETTLAVIEEL